MRAGPVTEGAPEPLGVTPVAGGVNVAVASASAEAVEVCFFDDSGAETRIRLPGRTGEVFHGHVAGVEVGARYGLRAHGPFAPEHGHRFDPAKLLVDPYAVELDVPFVLHEAMFSQPGDFVDSAAVMPKAIVRPAAAPAPPQAPIPWADTVIYEAHVRGLTMQHPDVPPELRGRFAALAHPAVIGHLTRLGVTTLELLPVAAWIDERHLGPLGLTNYWGYNPVVMGAPDPRLAPEGWPEVRAAVDALRAAGIETILDVVFNHTGEGDHLGPTLSLRGLDNAHAYWLRPDDPSRYVDDAGTGSTLRLDTPQGVRLVTEALRTWVRRGGVAGFRFDLATVLGRRANGFDPHAPLLAAIGQDPELRGLKLIAEPWDCGPGGYQLGGFPGAWGEWNDRFRDDVRRFWRGDGQSLGVLARRLAGSQDIFGARGHPSRSVNFVTAHDGFTLADLVSFTAKHNEANGEQNRDGHNDNASWNCGVEGPTDDPAVLDRRAADQRALLATLLLARGTPMLAAGAELGHSQGGNNNAYAQDNAISWIDWAAADQGLAAFTARLVAARKDHLALRRDRFLTGAAVETAWPDVEWLGAEAGPLTPAQWDALDGGLLQMVLAAPTAEGGLDRVTVIVNRGGEVEVALAPARDGHAWRKLADSAAPDEEGVTGDRLKVASRSVLLLAEAPEPTRRRGVDDAELARLAEQAGICPEWWSLDGTRHAVTPQTQRALLAAMGLPANTPDALRDSRWRLGQTDQHPLPACKVLRQSESLHIRTPADGWLEIVREDGSLTAVRAAGGEAELPALPPGVHRLRQGASEGTLIVAPHSAYEPPDLTAGARRFGLTAQLYALRRAGDQGVGDFTTLAELGGRASQLGASFIALNPLHALFEHDRERASPYQPSDRRFLDPLYLDVAEFVGETPGVGGASIDYTATWAAKRPALDAAVQRLDADPAAAAELAAFIAAGGAALAQFCTFQALSAARGGDWRDWPAELRDPGSAAVAEFARAHAAEIRRHHLLQWLCETRLAAAAARAPGLGLCRDLAVGAAPDGAEAWSAGERWAHAVSIGAPPDAFSPDGQVWGLTPPIPHLQTQEAYASFRTLLAANMRHAGALRVDHVLGLSRLFWVPEGADGADGAYVRYPEADLLSVLALESHRARCLVIGEDLGTVPDGLRDALEAQRIYSYDVLPFERDGEAFRSPRRYGTTALACVATHDLPPLAGWWEGADLAERTELGLLPAEGLDPARESRRNEKSALLEAMAADGVSVDADPDQPFTPPLAAAIHAFVAAAPSRLMAVQVEDLAGETVPINLPGTDRERPNWRRRLSVETSSLGSTDLSRAILAGVITARAEP